MYVYQYIKEKRDSIVFPFFLEIFCTCHVLANRRTFGSVPFGHGAIGHSQSRLNRISHIIIDESELIVVNRDERICTHLFLAYIVQSSNKSYAGHGLP